MYPILNYLLRKAGRMLLAKQIIFRCRKLFQFLDHLCYKSSKSYCFASWFWPKYVVHINLVDYFKKITFHLLGLEGTAIIINYLCHCWCCFLANLMAEIWLCWTLVHIKSVIFINLYKSRLHAFYLLDFMQHWSDAAQLILQQCKTLH